MFYKMNLLNSILKVFVGDKAKKDIKEISPLVSKINSIEDEFIKLSNDELRSKTEKFKSEISNIKNPYQIKIDLINEKIENESSIDQKESFYNEIEGLENKNWVLLDYVDVVVHIFKKEFREIYNLEELWADAKIIRLDNLNE